MVLLSLYAILIQLVIGTVIVYAQAPTSSRFSSGSGRFSVGALATPREERSIETVLAITDARLEQYREQIADLKSQLVAMGGVVSAQDDRLKVLERVNENMGKVLRLIYGLIVTASGALIVAIINMRMQRKRRGEQLSKDEVRQLLAELNAGKS